MPDTEVTKQFSTANGIDIEQNIAQDCLRLLNKYLLIPSVPGNLLCSLLVLLGLYTTSSAVIFWFIAMCVVLFIRVSFYFVYLIKPKSYQLNFILFFVGTALVAAAWGYVGSFLMPANDILHQSIIIIIIAGVTSGALQSLQASKWISMSYIILAIVPLTAWLYLQDSYIYMLLGVSMTIYCAFMLTACMRGYSQFIETFKLRYENNCLIDNLSITSNQLTVTNNFLLAEIEGRKKIENKYKELATHDPLTRLPNRAYMLQFLQSALKRAKRFNTKLAVLYADLDDFKKINDNFGHDEGDKILIKTAEVLKKSVRESDIVSRIGGDEFIIVMENIISSQRVLQKAELLSQKLHQELRAYDPLSLPTISIGISLFPENGEVEQLLIKNADTALYEAKRLGKDRVVLYHA